jgi:hypothetical protein
VWIVLALPVGAFVLPLLSSTEAGGLGAAGVAASGLVLVGASISLRGIRRARGDMVAMARVALADALIGGVVVVAAARAGAGIAGIFTARVAASLFVTAGGMLGRDRPSSAARCGRAWRNRADRAARGERPPDRDRSGRTPRHDDARGGDGRRTPRRGGARPEVLGVLPEGALRRSSAHGRRARARRSDRR